MRMHDFTYGLLLGESPELGVRQLILQYFFVSGRIRLMLMLNGLRVR